MNAYDFVNLNQYSPTRWRTGGSIHTGGTLALQVLKKRGGLDDNHCVVEGKLLTGIKTGDKPWSWELASGLKDIVESCTKRFVIGDVVWIKHVPVPKRFRWGQNGWNSSAHANMFILDKERKEIEIFDPHGAYGRVSICEAGFMAYFRDKFPAYSIVPMLKYIPNKGPQSRQSRFKHELGYCMTWCIMWGHLRLANPTLSRNQIAAFFDAFDGDALLDMVERYVTFTLETVNMTSLYFGSWSKINMASRIYAEVFGLNDRRGEHALFRTKTRDEIKNEIRKEAEAQRARDDQKRIEELRNEKFSRSAYLAAAADDDVNTLRAMLYLHGRELKGDIMTPFYTFVQFAPQHPETVLLLLREGVAAGEPLPPTSRLLDLYHRKPDVIQMLARKTDLLNDLSKETCGQMGRFFTRAGVQDVCAKWI